ncbi:hypothetical protein M8J77_005534 [Diaphorina citri]|nr:hypothetical protein M8J77_005534 [Diaphorina citri]
MSGFNSSLGRHPLCFLTTASKVSSFRNRREKEDRIGESQPFRERTLSGQDKIRPAMQLLNCPHETERTPNFKHRVEKTSNPSGIEPGISGLQTYVILTLEASDIQKCRRPPNPC